MTYIRDLDPEVIARADRIHDSARHELLTDGDKFADAIDDVTGRLNLADSGAMFRGIFDAARLALTFRDYEAAKRLRDTFEPYLDRAAQKLVARGDEGG